MSTCLSLHKNNKDTTYSNMQSENELLRQQISDLQSQLVLTKKITDLQDEINSLRQQNFELKTENTRLSNLKTNNKQKEIVSSDDDDYYTADEWLDNIDRTCQYCRKVFKYPSRLRE